MEEKSSVSKQNKFLEAENVMLKSQVEILTNELNCRIDMKSQETVSKLLLSKIDMLDSQIKIMKEEQDNYERMFSFFIRKIEQLDRSNKLETRDGPVLRDLANNRLMRIQLHIQHMLLDQPDNDINDSFFDEYVMILGQLKVLLTRDDPEDLFL